MAQTKAKAQTKRKTTTRSAKPKSKTQGTSRKSTTSSGTGKRASSSSRRRTQGSTGTQGRTRRPQSDANGRGLLDRAKGPAAAAGVALLGAAGMAAATRNNKRRRLPKPGTMPRPDLTKARKALKKVELPNPDDAIDWVEGRARSIGDTGHRVADMTSQARTVKNAVTGR